MARKLACLVAGAVVAACALPKVEVDETLAPGTGGTGAVAGSGSASGGSAGTGKGGSGMLGGGGSGVVAGQAGAPDDARELACGDYCKTYLANCLTSTANTYDDLDDCLNTCFTSDWPFGTDDAQPNSVQCRVLHAHLAKSQPVPHCFHSAEFPTGTSCAL